MGLIGVGYPPFGLLGLQFLGLAAEEYTQSGQQTLCDPEFSSGEGRKMDVLAGVRGFELRYDPVPLERCKIRQNGLENLAFQQGVKKFDLRSV
jgi:hypothetical protein